MSYPILTTLKQPVNRWVYGMKNMGYENTKKKDFPNVNRDYILPFQYNLFK